jgi:hypothetical protein
MKLPKLSPAWTARIKRIATDIVTAGGALTAVLTIAIAVGPTMHVTHPEMVILITAMSVVSALVSEARRITQKKIAAVKAAKTSG